MNQMIIKIKEIVSCVSDIDIAEIEKLAEDENLFSGGLSLDSFKAIELIFQLEQMFSIELSDEDITLKNIDSINQIASLVNRNK
jgi:acyl carrier protein